MRFVLLLFFVFVQTISETVVFYYRHDDLKNVNLDSLRKSYFRKFILPLEFRPSKGLGRAADYSTVLLIEMLRLSSRSESLKLDELQFQTA